MPDTLAAVDRLHFPWTVTFTYFFSDFTNGVDALYFRSEDEDAANGQTEMESSGQILDANHQSQLR